MIKASHFWVLTALSLISAVVAVVNMVLFHGARTAQLEVQAQQQFIQQTVPLEVLHRDLVRVLAELSVRNRDTELRDMLAAQGVKIAAPAASPSGAATPAPRKPGN